jgi:hypothetical protein
MAVLAACCVLLSHIVTAQSTATEDVEAAYLYQFGRYVEWPDDLPGNSDTFKICVLGTDPLGDILGETVEGKVLTGRPVAAIQVQALEESRNCQILFIGPSENERMPEYLKALAGARVLTVGRGADFTRRGGMIGFTSEDRRVRFVINVAAAETAKLMLSSRLLRIAIRVER